MLLIEPRGVPNTGDEVAERIGGPRPGAGQWNLRSAAAIGRSLIEAMRRRIRPLSSNSQFSLP